MTFKIHDEIFSILELGANCMAGRSGYVLRRLYFSWRLRVLGAGAVVGPGLLTIGPANIRIGDNFSCWRNCTIAACDDGLVEIGDRVALNQNVYINACGGGRIVLGDDVLIAPNVVMRSCEHNTDNLDKPINQQGHSKGEIVVEEDVWIASNATITGKIRIGRGAVVAAGAVVVRDVEPYTMVGGVPARFIKKRGKNDKEM